MLYQSHVHAREADQCFAYARRCYRLAVQYQGNGEALASETMKKLAVTWEHNARGWLQLAGICNYWG